MNVLFQGQLTPSDVRKAVALHQNVSLVSLIGIALLGIVLFTAGFTVLAPTKSSIPFMIVGIVLAVVAIMQHPAIVSRLLLRPSETLMQPRQGSVSDENVTMQLPTKTEEIAWYTFCNQKQSDEMALLYTTKNCFLIFPRTFFPSEAAWHQFKATAAHKIQTSV